MFIFVSGFRGSGKDEFYKQLSQKRIKSSDRIAIADTIKSEAAEIHKFNLEFAHDPREKDVPRQELGGLTIREVCRKFSEDKSTIDKTYFAKVAINKIKNKLLASATEIDSDIKDKLFILTDFRFECDLLKFKDAFPNSRFITIRIIRHNHKEPDRLKEPEEYALENFKFDYILLNDGSLEDYSNKIHTLMTNSIFL